LPNEAIPVRDFLLAYLAILVTPGPNLLVIAGVAALRGLRGALPICLGIALGAGTLNAALAATLLTAPVCYDGPDRARQDGRRPHCCSSSPSPSAAPARPGPAAPSAAPRVRSSAPASAPR
jgi:hypothetical protein